MATSCQLYHEASIDRVLSSSGRIDWLRSESAEEELLRSATTLAWKLSYLALSEISSCGLLPGLEQLNLNGDAPRLTLVGPSEAHTHVTVVEAILR